MEFTLLQLGLFALGGLTAAAINAVAGGGTFLVFPLLIFAGLPPVAANIVNKTGIWSGALASLLGYWREVRALRSRVAWLAAVATLGSLGGSLLLLATPPALFAELVPWLLLGATLLFAFGKRLLAFVHRHTPDHPGKTAGAQAAGWLGQLVIGIYGGFFGAGKGIMMVALYELMGIRSIHEINGMKAAVASAINTVSVAAFALAGVIIWPAALAMMAGAALGGFFGARLARRLPQAVVRGFIIAYGLGVSGYFFFA